MGLRGAGGELLVVCFASRALRGVFECWSRWTQVQVMLQHWQPCPPWQSTSALHFLLARVYHSFPPKT
eukprot:205206-Pelagomonas_calceolata.AAC.5